MLLPPITQTRHRSLARLRADLGVGSKRRVQAMRRSFRQLVRPSDTTDPLDSDRCGEKNDFLAVFARSGPALLAHKPVFYRQPARRAHQWRGKIRPTSRTGFNGGSGAAARIIYEHISRFAEQPDDGRDIRAGFAARSHGSGIPPFVALIQTFPMC